MNLKIQNQIKIEAARLMTSKEKNSGNSIRTLFDARETRGVRRRKCYQHLGGRTSSRVNFQQKGLAGHPLPAPETNHPDSNQLVRVRIALSSPYDTQNPRSVWLSKGQHAAVVAFVQHLTYSGFCSLNKRLVERLRFYSNRSCQEWYVLTPSRVGANRVDFANNRCETCKWPSSQDAQWWTRVKGEMRLWSTE